MYNVNILGTFVNDELNYSLGRGSTGSSMNVHTKILKTPTMKMETDGIINNYFRNFVMRISTKVICT